MKTINTQYTEKVSDNIIKFKMLFENTSNLVARIGKDFTFRYVNPSWLNVFKKSPEKVLFSKIPDVLGINDEVLILMHVIEKVISEKKPYTIEQIYYGIQYSSQIIPEFNDSGETESVIAISIDVTQNKKTESDLIESEKRYEELVELMPDGILVHSQDTIVFANSTTAKILHANDKNDLIGKKYLDLIHPDYKKIVNAKINDIFEKDESAPVLEPKLIGLDGTIIDVEILASKIIFKGEQAVSVIIRDITERKKTEKVIKESEIKFRTIFERAGIGMIILELDGRIIESNESFQKMIGYSEKDLRMMNISQLMHPDDSESNLALFTNDSLKEKISRNYRGDKRLIHKDGKLIWGKLTLTYLKDDKGEPRLGILMIENISENKKIEKALKDSEQLLAESQKQANIGSWELYIDKGEYKWSRQTFHIFGMDPDLERPLGDKYWEYVHPEDKQRLYTISQRAIQTKTAYKVAHRMILPDGTIKYIESIGKPFFDENGKLIKFVGTLLDVTQNIISKDILKESEERLNTLINASPDIICFKDGSGRWLIANESDLELFELKGVNYKGKKDSELAAYSTFYKDAFMNCETSDELTWVNGKISRCEEIVDKPDGSIIVLDIIKIPIFYEDGKRKGLVVLGRDISKRKQAEEALIISETNYKTLLNSVDQIFILVNTEFKVISYNKLAKKMSQLLFGKRIKLGGNIFEFVDDESKEKIRNRFINAFNGISFTGQINFNLPDNIKKWFEIHYDTVKTDEGKVLGATFSAIEITQRKLAEQELTLAKEKAEQASLFKSNLMSNMSHEFRTPMSGILGFAEILEQEITDPEQLDMLNAISNSGKRLLNTLTSLLKYSQLESEIFDTNIKELKLSDIVLFIVNNYKSFAVSKNLELNYNICNNEKFIFGDDEMVKHILSNITDNAIKFTKNGFVSLELSYEQESEKNWMVCKIKDTGIGIGKSSMEMIFQGFRQASEGIGRVFEGNGLGLAIAKKIINILGGKIEVESEINKGSIFSVYFPAKEEDVTDEFNSSDDKIESELSLKNKTQNVLLIEDNKSNGAITKIFLKDICKVDVADNAEIAFEYVKQKQYSAIIIDIHLGPGMNGIGVAEELRKMENYKNTPMIALTGYAMYGDKEKLLSFGFKDYIAKPFTKDTITEALKKILK